MLFLADNHTGCVTSSTGLRADIRKAWAVAKQPDPSAGTRSAPAWNY
jgi:hypothetical protein